VTVPKEFGGAGRSRLENAALKAELAYHRAPILGHFVVEQEVVPAIVRHGSEWQKRELLPQMLLGQVLCGQAFTEPAAGSDLASLTTSAVLADGKFIINGVKWLNSVTHVANYIWLIARTDAESSRHRGLSLILVPAQTPGIRIEPLVEMTRIHRLNRITFSDVIVDQQFLVGPLHHGWDLAMETVNSERAGAARPASCWLTLQEAWKEWRANKPSSQDLSERNEYARFATEICARIATRLSRTWALPDQT
jgi:alkylation response protein AidB-like acyl-CoA dehydrogenase